LRAKGKKATAQSGNYQDNITGHCSCDHDDNATDPNVVDANLDLDDDTDPARHVLPTVERVSVAALHIHSQFKLRHDPLAPKDHQGHPFKSSTSPSLDA